MPLSCFWNCSNAQQMFWREQQAQRWLDSMVVSCSFMGDTQFWDILDLFKVHIYIAGSHGRTKHPVVTRCHLCLYTLPNFSWRSKRWDIVGPYWTDVELIQLYSYISYTCGWTDGGANSVLGYDLQGPHNNIEAWTADLERWGAENAAPFRSSWEIVVKEAASSHPVALSILFLAKMFSSKKLAR